MGYRKFEKIFRRIEMQKERAALHLWQDKVKQLIKAEKRENYMKLRASRKLDHFVHRMQSNEMASAFHLWLSQIIEERERERRQLEDLSARKIQNLARSYLARRHVYQLKMRIQEAKRMRLQAKYRPCTGGELRGSMWQLCCEKWKKTEQLCIYSEPTVAV